MHTHASWDFLGFQAIKALIYFSTCPKRELSRQTKEAKRIEAIYEYAPDLKANESEVMRTVEIFEEKTCRHAKSKQEYAQRLDEKLNQFMQITQITKTEYPPMRPSFPTKVGSPTGTSINNSVDAEDWKDELLRKVETFRKKYHIQLHIIYQQILEKLQQELTADILETCQHIKKIIEVIVTDLQLTRSQITPDFKQTLDALERHILRLLLATIRQNPSSQHKEPLHSNIQAAQRLHQSNSIISHWTLYEKKQEYHHPMIKEGSSEKLQNPPPNNVVLQQQVSKLNKEQEKLVKMERKNCKNPNNKVLATHPPTCQFSSTTSGEDATNLLSSYGMSGSLETSDPLKPATASVTYSTGNTDKSTNCGSETNYDVSDAIDQPICRLIKIVSEMSKPALIDCIEEMRSVVCANNMNFCQSPSVGPKIFNDEDLHALTNSWAKIFLTGQHIPSRKRKCEFDVVPHNHISRHNANANDNSEVPLSNGYTKPSAEVGNEVNGALLEELREVNKRLIDIVVKISEEDTNCSCSVVGSAAGGRGTILKCCFTGISCNFESVSDLPVNVGALVQPLRLLVPTSYPFCSPVFLDNMEAKLSEEHDDFTKKARAKLQLLLRCLSVPMSIAEIVTSWEFCVRQVIDEYAFEMGGATFRSRHGSWKRLV